MLFTWFIYIWIETNQRVVCTVVFYTDAQVSMVLVRTVTCPWKQCYARMSRSVSYRAVVKWEGLSSHIAGDGRWREACWLVAALLSLLAWAPSCQQGVTIKLLILLPHPDFLVLCSDYCDLIAPDHAGWAQQGRQTFSSSFSSSSFSQTIPS